MFSKKFFTLLSIFTLSHSIMSKELSNAEVRQVANQYFVDKFKQKIELIRIIENDKIFDKSTMYSAKPFASGHGPALKIIVLKNGEISLINNSTEIHQFFKDIEVAIKHEEINLKNADLATKYLKKIISAFGVYSGQFKCVSYIENRSYHCQFNSKIPNDYNEKLLIDKSGIIESLK